MAAKCSFLGRYNIYESKLYEKLKKAIDSIAQEQDGIDFLFYSNGGFFDSCFLAAWEAKQVYPDKEITITVVRDNEEATEYVYNAEQGETVIPPCIIDKVIVAPPFSISQNYVARQKKMRRWLIEQSTHIISYLYEGFHEAEYQQYKYAKHRGAKIIDVTDAETAAYIAQSIDTLEEREQKIIRSLESGKTLNEIAAGFGVSSSAIRETLKHACRHLRERTARRAYKMFVQNAKFPIICSIFLMGNANYQSLVTFEQAALYLAKNCGVTQFNILQEYCHSGYAYVLKKLSESNQSMHLIAITHYPDFKRMTKEEWHNAASPYCPPCHAVENIDTYTDDPQEQTEKAIGALIEQSDFCICYLADNPLKEKVGKHIATAGSVKLLDLSRRFSYLPKV